MRIPKAPKLPLGIVVIGILVLFIFIANYTPGTFLTGWDNIHPEFNFGLNIKRSLFSAWQEYQGLGLPAGTGYASDLPRQLFLWLLSLVLPLSFLRYFYHFLALFVGALGVYVLLKKIVLSQNDDIETTSILGAVFYLFNLATMQMFFVPFEPVSHHFASLPWLLFGNLHFFKHPTRRNLLILFLINVLAVPQGYVTTYFLVTLVTLGILFFGYILYHVVRQKNKTISAIKQVGVAFFILLAFNSYWLLPNIYYLLTNTQTTLEAHANQMSTEENFLKNKKYGDLPNTMLLKGFWFDNVDTRVDGSISYQLQEWIPHINNPFFAGIGYLLFLLCMLGIGVAWKKKIIAAFFIIPVFLFAFTIISNDTPVFSQIASLLYKLPLFSQVFRFPFTKFAIVTALCLSLFYAMFYTAFLHSQKLKSWKIHILLFLMLLPLLFVYPYFTGKFLDTRNKLKIPDAYFQTFEFFKNQPKDGRIANFPQYTFWGWTWNKWDYRGSGLWWYAVEQPMLDRAFDVWSKTSENYYHEISYAIYSENIALFEQVLEKYHIKWLLVDDSVISFSSQKHIYFSKLNEFLKDSQKIKVAKTFNQIRIYEVNLNLPPTNFVLTANNPPVVYPPSKWNNFDKAYSDLGTYISPPPFDTFVSSDTFNVFYPFRSLFSGKTQDLKEFQVTEHPNYFSFQALLPASFQQSTLHIPYIVSEEISEIDPKNFSEALKFPKIFLDGVQITLDKKTPDKNNMFATTALPAFEKGKLEIQVPKIAGYYSYDSSSDPNLLLYPPHSCNPFNSDAFSHQSFQESGTTWLKIKSINANNCFDIDLPNLSHRLSYMVQVTSRYRTGRSLLFAIQNSSSARFDTETFLPKTKNDTTSTFIIPPMEEYGAGYTLHFDNISIGKEETKNDLGKVTVHQIPYRFLTGLKLENRAIPSENETPTFVSSVTHPNPSFYEVHLNNSIMKQLNNQVLILSQAYDPGWKAYRTNVKCQMSNVKCNLTQNPKDVILNLFQDLSSYFPFFFGTELKEHVLVNNWSNGWLIDKQRLTTNDQRLILVFWPQYLEYLGFLIVFLTGIGIVVSYSKQNSFEI